MANESTDVLMTFIGSSGSGLAAECSSVWNESDGLSTDFKAGYFFEVEDFSLGGGLESSDGSATDGSPTNGNGAPRGNELRERDDLDNSRKEDRKGRDGSRSKAAHGGRGNRFAKYVLEKADPKKFLKLDVPEISVSRQMDMCSPLLFSACMDREAFTKAVIVKRKIVGGVDASGVTVPMMGYLRFEFDAPLITSIDWEDGDVVKEKFKFVCRGIKMTYRPQNPDGSLGEGVPATWSVPSTTQTGSSPSSV